MKRFVVLVLLVTLLIATTANAFFNEEKSSETPVTLYFITSEILPTTSQTMVLQNLSKIPSYDIKLSYHEYSPELFPDLEVLPAFFYSEDLIKQTKVFGVLTTNHLVTPNTTTFRKLVYEVPYKTYGPSLYLQNQPKSGQLELFYRPFCPYGMSALKALQEASAKKNSAIKKLVLTPILRERSGSSSTKALQESFEMMGALPEMEEAVRQIIIYNNWPAKLGKYIENRKDIRSSFWAEAAQQAGLDVEQIGELAESKSFAILQQGAKRTAEMAIKASPTYLWENQARFNHTQELLAAPQFKGLKLINGKESCH